MEDMWSSEDNFEELALFYHVDQRLAGLVSYVTSPIVMF